LKSGADANAEYDGFAGTMLAKALICGQPQSIRQLLVDNGASIEGAIGRARAKNGYSRADIETLRGFQKKTADKPAAPDADLRELILEVQKEVRVLAERMDRALPLKETPDANQPEETRPPATGLKLRMTNKGP
jgi:hypothetical protein